MKLAITSALLLCALTNLVSSATISRRSCPEASRFGNPTITPQFKGPFSPGDPITINVDLTCAVENFDIVPQFIDYTIEVLGSANNGHEQPIVLARHTIPPGALSDSVSTTIPHAFYFAGAPYTFVTTVVYPVNATDGSETAVILEGSVDIPINITASV